MSLLNELKKEEAWNDFRQYKTERSRLTRQEEKELDVFIAEKRYLEPLVLGIPEKRILSKMGSSKKRTIYSFNDDVMWNLKLLAYLLYRYDAVLCDSCYSFRRNRTAKTAFDCIKRIKGLKGKYALKADIQNYFNSIPAERLIEMLENVISDDPELLQFLSDLLRTNHCMYNKEVLQEEMGAMAGVPLASFFANIYLMDLDHYYEEKGIDYFRYSDDILIFADSEEETKQYHEELAEYLKQKGLTMNLSKVNFYTPDTGFEFLGFQCRDGQIDLSDTAIEKMKGKIRRKARSLNRRKDAKGLSFEQTAKRMIRSFDSRFYDVFGTGDYSWTRFCFPVLTCSDGLKKIDEYMVMYLRYLCTGRHNKGNYKVTYEQLKSYGYTSLVHEFYAWKKENEKLNRENAQES